jgi:hypothetical protein
MFYQQDYSPVVGGIDWSDEEVVELLFDGLQLSRRFFEETLVGINKPADFTEETFTLVAAAATRDEADLLAGLACWTGEDISESTLCAANGAAHQELVRSIRDVLALIDRKHIRKALFSGWQRDFEVLQSDRKRLNLGSRKPTLRLDPSDERLYALRATDPMPASSAFRTELGAQALAVRAFSVLPVVPRRRPLAVASERTGNRVFFNWYLWNQPATLASVRSLLVSGGEASDLRARGVFAQFRAARIAGEKGKLSFAPSEGVW